MFQKVKENSTKSLLATYLILGMVLLFAQPPDSFLGGKNKGQRHQDSSGPDRSPHESPYLEPRGGKKGEQKPMKSAVQDGLQDGLLARSCMLCDSTV